MAARTSKKVKGGRNHSYTCMVCGKDKHRDDLVVKKTVYMEMGSGARTLRSRVVGWVCKADVEKDPDWNREPWVDAPGFAPVEE